MTGNLILFFLLAAVAIGSALGMLFSRNAVYSALYLIVNFMTVALFYLMLHAPFIAISQVTVYAGAIMVLFLFVIMLLGAEQTGRTPSRWWLQPVALFMGVILLVEMAVVIVSLWGSTPENASVASSFGTPLAIGEMLFTRYLLPFEATSILLLTALVGAIVMTRGEKK
jgi:NADH-quinone oxidoreductase subunit J